MKILYAITKATWGGAQLYVYNLATEGKKRGHEVTVVAGQKGLLFEKLEAAGIRTILIPELERDINPLLDIKSFFSLIRLFRTEKPDVVHLNSSKIGGIGTLAARLTGIPKIIFTAHGWPFLEERPWVQTKVIYLLSWLTALFSTHTLDITRTTWNRVTKWPLVGHKIHLITLGINERNLTFLSREEAHKELNIPEGVFAVGLATEFTKNKGVPYALQALAHIKNPAINLYITGRGELESELRHKAKELGIEERVHFLGFKDSVARYFKAFDLLIIPSIKEGLPLTIIEAGHAKLPVIGTRVGGIPELLDRESGIVVEPRNPEALAEAIEALAENSALRERLGSRLHERVNAMFNIREMFLRTFRLYENSHVPRAIGIVPENKEGKLLLNLRDANTGTAPSQWCIVGGHVEPGENIETTALRELKEETGLEGTHLEHLYEYPEYNCTVFTCRVEADDSDIVVGEGTAMKFFSPDELNELMETTPYDPVHLRPIKNILDSKAL